MPHDPRQVTERICGPWIPDDGRIFTHTISTAGKMTQTNWTAKVWLSCVIKELALLWEHWAIRLEPGIWDYDRWLPSFQVVLFHQGVTSLIAHIRVGNMQVALEATSTVLPAIGTSHTKYLDWYKCICQFICVSHYILYRLFTFSPDLEWVIVIICRFRCCNHALPFHKVNMWPRVLQDETGVTLPTVTLHPVVLHMELCEINMKVYTFLKHWLWFNWVVFKGFWQLITYMFVPLIK